LEKIFFFLTLGLILSSGSIFGAAYSQRRFEEFLPFSFTAIVAVLLLAGVMDAMLAGLYIILLIAICLLLAAVVHLFQLYRKHSGEFIPTLSRIVSPGAIVFVALCALFLYIDFGRYCRGWDSFSHWAPTVKAMYYLDSFITNELAQAWYPSYPPGMSLAQYVFVKLYSFWGGQFQEWILYYAYQLFFASFLLPFICFKEDKNALPCILRALVLFLVIAYGPSYTAIEVDQVMGIVLGGGLAAILLSRERGNYCCAYACCAAFVLVLFKAAGVLLGAFVASALILAVIGDEYSLKEKLTKALAALMSVVVPFSLWLFERKRSGITQSFSSKEADFDAELILRLITGTEESYKQQGLQNCLSTLFGLRTDGAVIEINILLLMALMFGGLFLLGRWYSKHDKARPISRTCMWVLVLAEFIIFSIGTIFTIVLAFSPEEALGAASLERYMYTPVLAITIVFTLAMLNVSGKHVSLKYVIGILLVLCMTPYMYVFDIATRESVQLSREERYQFERTIENVNDICPDWSSVYVVAQGRYTPNWLQLRLGIYPCLIQEVCEWEELWAEPVTETVQKVTAEEWMSKLEKDYDYVALFKVDDYFIENYGELFGADSPVEEDAVYIVDRENGFLVKQS